MPATQLYRVLPCHIDTYKITTPWESGIRNSNYITLRIQGLNGWYLHDHDSDLGSDSRGPLGSMPVTY